MKTGDKVVFKQSQNDANASVFNVVDVQCGFAKIEPGTYGNKNMIVEVERLVVVG